MHILHVEKVMEWGSPYVCIPMCVCVLVHLWLPLFRGQTYQDEFIWLLVADLLMELH